MTSIEIVEGPLDPRQLDRIADLYGAVDTKYKGRSFLEHLFVDGPAGAALHAFGVAGEAAVAHAAVVPTPGRIGDRPLRAGKLEALVVAQPYRGSRAGAAPLVQTLLAKLYEHADATGYEVLHAFVHPRVGRTIRFTPVAGVTRPSLVAVLDASRTARAEVVMRAIAGGQSVPRIAVGALAGRKRRSGVVRELARGDEDLFDVPALSRGQWAVVGENAFSWYARSPAVRVLEDRDIASRLLVQLPLSDVEPMRIAAWRAERPTLRAAATALVDAVGTARAAGAAAVRIQIVTADPPLRRAAALLGFVPTRDLTTLWLRAADPALARREAVVATPLLYLGF